MRTITMLLLLFVFSAGHAQDAKRSFLGKEKKLVASTSARKIKNSFLFRPEKSGSVSLFHNRHFSTNASVDLYDGKGIHLFSIDAIGPLPSVSVGAKFNAGLVIHI